MTQVLSTIFFSAAALAAVGVLLMMLMDNIGDIRRALGLADAAGALPSAHIRIRRTGRNAVMPVAASPLRAAA